MSGGGSDDPNVQRRYIQLRRIRFSTTTVLIGFGITVYAILKNPKKLK
jgi:hypothetical protein